MRGAGSITLKWDFGPHILFHVAIRSFVLPRYIFWTGYARNFIPHAIGITGVFFLYKYILFVRGIEIEMLERS